MLIHFWGVRGSLPSSLSPIKIRNKFISIFNQLRPEDIATAESRKHFLEGLPPWLYGTVGGNTPCVSLSTEGFNEPLVFDCGSGLREMGITYCHKIAQPVKYHIFFSHFHWDHMQGLPFFIPAYKPAVTMDYYSPFVNMENALFGQMNMPYFPIQMENLAAKRNFHLLSDSLTIGPYTVSFRKMNHPGVSYAYRINQNGKTLIYATDAELSTNDFTKSEENTAFFSNADMVIMDSQYTLGEAIEKFNWGHSAFSMAVDFAVNWGVKHLILFHHDPEYDDRKLYGLLQAARWYLQRMNVADIEITLAVEGLEITL